MSLGEDARIEAMVGGLFAPEEMEIVTGSYDEVKSKCNELAKHGYKYSKGGYVKKADGTFERKMYLWQNY